MVAIANAADDLEARRAAGTMSVDIREPSGASGLVTATTMKKAAKACVRGEPLLAVDAPFVPTRVARVVKTSGSAPPCGSVIAKHETISLSRSVKIGLLLRRGPVMRKDFGVAESGR